MLKSLRNTMLKDTLKTLETNLFPSIYQVKLGELELSDTVSISLPLDEWDNLIANISLYLDQEE